MMADHAFFFSIIQESIMKINEYQMQTGVVPFVV